MIKIKFIILLITQFLFLPCLNAESKTNTTITYFDSGFTLFQDTIHVNIKGEMTHALRYHDKLYVLFEQPVLKYEGHGKRWLYIFSNGQVEKVIDCPVEMETFYLDFYVNKDTLILKPYMDGQSYELDLENYKWNKIDKTDDLIYEDEKFRVYSLDFGEWGGKTWFKDRKTGLEYELESTAPLINRINTTYYLTNSFRVLKITNPLELNKCEADITYENIEASNRYSSWYGEAKGFDAIYKDTTVSYFDQSYKPSIVSSFVFKNELLHIYETDTNTYVARVRNHSIDTIQNIGENLSFYNWLYSYRFRNSNRSNELLKFNTKDEQVFGLMEITESKIFVHYFVNKAELKPRILGTGKADSLFVNRLNTILTDGINFSLHQIDLKEQNWGSFDITPNYEIGIGDNWNPDKYTIDTCKSYLIKEDSILSNSIIYYATKESDLIRVVTIDWDDETDFTNSRSEEVTKKAFDRKVNFLIDCISQIAGKEINRKEKKNYIEMVWETSTGLTIELEKLKNYNSIRLVFY